MAYIKRVHKITSPIFFHMENTFIDNECYIDGKAGLSAIFQCNHRCNRCTFACAVAFFILATLTIEALWSRS